jgi:6-phosphogluconolactonase (cycloisomerase 2 family)
MDPPPLSTPAAAASVVTAATASPGTPAQATGAVYTNDNANGPNTVSAYWIGPDGALIPVGGSPFFTGGTGTGIWQPALNNIIATSRGFLYAANQRSGDITAFAIDTAHATLSPIQQAHVASEPDAQISLAADASGRWLAAASGSSGRITMFSVRADGTLAPASPAPPAGGRPAAIKISADGRFLAATLAQDGRITVFTIAEDGALTPAPGSPFVGSVVNADGLDFECSGQRVFVANDAIDRWTSTAIDVFQMSDDGRLSLLPASPFQTAGVSGGVPLVDPIHGVLFVTNQGVRNTGGDSVSAFRITSTGLSSNSGAPIPVKSGSVPVGMGLTRLGQYLLTANFPAAGSGASIGVFAIGADGSAAAVRGSPFPVPASNLTSLAVFPPAPCPGRPQS